MADLEITDYRTLVRRYIGEDIDETGEENERYPDSLIDMALNQGQIEYAEELGPSGFFRDADTVDATSTAIAKPANYLTGMLAYLVTDGVASSRPLESIRKTELVRDMPSWRSQTGTPTHLVSDYASGGLQWWLWPVLSATITDGLILDYTARPTDMTDQGEDAQVTSVVMNEFPSMQMLALPAAAIERLLMNEHGEADDQVMKWGGVKMGQLKLMRAYLNNRNMPRITQYGRR